MLVYYSHSFIASIRTMLGVCLLMLMFNSDSFSQIHQSCGTTEVSKTELQEYLRNSKYNNRSNFQRKSGTISGEIPVVIHVVTDVSDVGAECQNDIADPYTADDAYEALCALNDNFQVPFITTRNLDITFRLAELDAQGNRIKGIQRHRTIFTASGAAPGLNIPSAEARFPSDRYLNIWIVEQVNAANSSGLAFFPESGVQGVLMASGAMQGSNDFGQPPFGNVAAIENTLTHEIGHWLGLRHLWGNGLPANPNNCDTDDSDFLTLGLNYVTNGCTDCFINGQANQTILDEDTPNCIGNICNPSYPNDCGSNPPPLTNNYMDYTCNNNSFTGWQICVMRSVLAGPRNGVLNPAAFCNGANCGTVFLDQEESVFFEDIQNDGTMMNSIRINIADFNCDPNQINVVGLPQGSVINISLETETITLCDQSTIDCNFLLVDLVSVPAPEHNGDNIPFSLDFGGVTFTNSGGNSTPVVTRLDFTIDLIGGCDIAFTELDTEIQNDGLSWDNLAFPGFEDWLVVSLNEDFSTNPDDFNLSTNISTSGNLFFTDPISLVTTPGPIVLNGQTNFPNNAIPFSFPGTEGETTYVGFRIVTACGTSHYGWLRFYVPNDCTDALRINGIAIQMKRNTDILVGQQNCNDCPNSACLVSVWASSNVIHESPSAPGTLTSEFLNIDIIRGGNCANLSDIIQTPLPTGVNVSPAGQITFDPGFCNDFAIDLNANFNGTCIQGPTQIQFTVEKYDDGFSCHDFELTEFTADDINLSVSLDGDPFNISERLSITVINNGNKTFSVHHTSPLTLYLIDGLNPNSATEGLDLDLNTALANANLIEITKVTGQSNIAIITDDTEIEERRYLPMVIGYGCNDQRFATLSYTVNCYGHIFFHDFVHSNTPILHGLPMNTGNGICNNSIPGPYCLDNNDIEISATIVGGNLCFGNNLDICDPTFTYFYRCVGTTNFIPVQEQNGQWCVWLGNLDPCKVYEYFLQYSCGNYPPCQSDLSTFRITEVCVADCSGLQTPIVNGNDVTIVYNGPAELYELTVDGQTITAPAGNSATFNFTVNDCGTFYFDLEIWCCLDLPSFICSGQFDVDCSCDPVTPMNPTISSDFESATVTIPFNGITTNFATQFREVGDPNWINGPNANGNSTVVFTGLEPCTDYEFRVSWACNSTGLWSDWDDSEVIAFTTLCCDPVTPLDPTIVTDYQSATVTIPFNGFTNFFTTQFREVGDPNWTNGPQGNNNNVVTFVGLQPCTDYEFRVSWACTSTGVWSDWNASDIVTFTTLCCDPVTPLDPTIVTDYQSATVTIPFNGITNFFATQFREVGDPNWTNGPGGNNNNVITFAGLQPCTDYEFRVSWACNSTGVWSDWNDSEIIQFGTECCEPENPPTTSISTTYYTASIEVPYNAHSFDFEIEWSVANSGSWSQPTAIDANDVFINFLDQCTDYEVRIRWLCDDTQTPSLWSDWVIVGFSTKCCTPPVEIPSYLKSCREPLIEMLSLNLEGVPHQYLYGPRGGDPNSSDFQESAWSVSRYIPLPNVPECVFLDVYVRRECSNYGETAISEWYGPMEVKPVKSRVPYNTLTEEFVNGGIKLIAGDIGLLREFEIKINDGNPFSLWATTDEGVFVENLKPCDEVCWRVRYKCGDSSYYSCWMIELSDPFYKCVTIPGDCIGGDPDPDEELCGCDVIFMVDKSETVSDEELADMECYIQEKVEKLDSLCEGCDTQVSITSFGWTLEQQIDQKLPCDSTEVNIGKDINGRRANITRGLSTLLEWMRNGDLDPEKGRRDGEEESDSTKCKKVIILTDAECRDFSWRTRIDRVLMDASGVSNILRTEQNVDISIVHYNTYDENGNVTNDISDCEKVKEILGKSEEGKTKEPIEKEYDCMKEEGDDRGYELEEDQVDIAYRAKVNDDQILKVYPNPFSETIFFDIVLSSKRQIQIQVFDFSGKLVLTKELNDLVKGKNQVSLNSINTPGIYYYRTVIDGVQHKGKIVKI